MTPRERLLTALDNGKPDRLPGHVHSWMQYYLDTYLGGCDQYEAYERFGLDMAIYLWPAYEFDDRDLANWRVERVEMGATRTGETRWIETVRTPLGNLRSMHGSNAFTAWTIEPLVKTRADFEIFDKYFPVPIGIDGGPVRAAREKVGDRGIVRGGIWCYGQCGAWQSFCCLVGTQEAIMFALDEPGWVHHVEDSLNRKYLKVVEMMAGQTPFDLIELGGGAGSNTVISPAMHEEFCLPYDTAQISILHQLGFKTVYHLCGGLMRMLDLVAQNGTDGLETMTPREMGGDCDLAEANRRVGDRLFFIGGFDQNRGFERGDPKLARQMVFDLHAARPQGGYICCPSDHFFFGDPANVQAFADAVKDCAY